MELSVKQALAIVRNKTYANGALWNMTTEDERAAIIAALEVVERGGNDPDAVERAVKVVGDALDRVKASARRKPDLRVVG